MMLIVFSYIMLMLTSITAFVPVAHLCPSSVGSSTKSSSTVNIKSVNRKKENISFHSLLILKESKGFGKNVSNNNKNKKSMDVNSNINSSSTDIASSSTTATTTTTTPTTVSAGAEALARLRRQQAEQKDAELRAIREMKSMEEYVSNDPDAAVIPEQVAQRMGRRMLPFVGIPLFGVMGTFVLFWYLATYRNMEFQPAMVAFSTIGVLGISLLGITYSVMSASWDPEKEGSFLGIDEFKTNLDNVKDGLKRTKENAILREKMAGLPEEEIRRAIDDLNKRDERAMKSKMTMEEKLNKELE